MRIWQTAWVVFGMFLLFSGKVEAKTAKERPTFCGDYRKLFEKVKNCQQNSQYSNLAAACVVRLDKAIEKTGLGLERALGGSGADQEKFFQDQKSNLVKTKKQLGRLISASDAAVDDMNLYLLHFRQPEDLDNPHINGGNPAAYAESFPCYQETRDVLFGARTVFESRSGTLRAAYRVAHWAETSAKERSGALDSLTEKIPTGGPQAPASPTPQGKDIRKSDISGQKPKEKSR